MSPRTLFADISSLPPGHLLLAQHGEVGTQRYWDLDYPLAGDIDPAAAPDFGDLEERLRRAVGRRLQADVPVAFYLSGGFDSSLVAALIHDVDITAGSSRKRHAFSIGFAERRIDERPQQVVVARQTGAHHHVEMFGADAIECRLQQAVRRAGAPLKESTTPARSRSRRSSAGRG